MLRPPSSTVTVSRAFLAYPRASPEIAVIHAYERLFGRYRIEEGDRRLARRFPSRSHTFRLYTKMGRGGVLCLLLLGHFSRWFRAFMTRDEQVL